MLIYFRCSLFHCAWSKPTYIMFLYVTMLLYCIFKFLQPVVEVKMWAAPLISSCCIHSVRQILFCCSWKTKDVIHTRQFILNTQGTDESENCHFDCRKTFSEKECHAHFVKARQHVYFNAFQVNTGSERPDSDCRLIFRYFNLPREKAT